MYIASLSLEDSVCKFGRALDEFYKYNNKIFIKFVPALKGFTFRLKCLKLVVNQGLDDE